MKKIISFVLAMIFLLIFAGCNGAASDDSDRFSLNVNQGVFDLSSCLPDFKQTYGVHTYSYQLNDAGIQLGIYKNTDIWAFESIDNYEKRSENGIEYYFRTLTLFADGMDEETGKLLLSDKVTTNEIIFSIDDYTFKFAEHTQKEDNAALNLQLALDMLGNKTIPELKSMGTSLSATLNNDELVCHVTLISTDNPKYSEYLSAKEDSAIQVENGIQYIASITDRQPDDPNARYIVCNTDKGALLISSGVPYDERNNVPDDKLDFVNVSLAMDIAKRLEIEIMSLS